MQPPQPPTHTLDSSLNKFQEYDVLPEDIVHSFAAETSDSVAMLKDLVQATGNISDSLSAYITANWTNPKLVSLLREGSGIAHTLHTVRRVLFYPKVILNWSPCSSQSRRVGTS
jgi:hypothetical protein